MAIICASILAIIIDIDNNKHYLFSQFASQQKFLFINISQSISSAISLPNFSKIFANSNPDFAYNFAISTISIYLVGSIETILSAIAIDKIDPQKRNSNLNKDLKAIGFGNLICGFVGALPMISEMVRSSASISFGGNNKWANFFHGLSLFIFVTIFVSLINFIPLCVLAAMLILVGINLINFPLIKQFYYRWPASILVILTVIFFTLYIDLLAGVFTGIIAYYIAKKFSKIHANNQ